MKLFIMKILVVALAAVTKEIMKVVMELSVLTF